MRCLCSVVAVATVAAFAALATGDPFAVSGAVAIVAVLAGALVKSVS